MGRKIVLSADEGVRLLKELLETPRMTSFHFELDRSVGKAPMVRYTVGRYAYTVEE